MIDGHMHLEYGTLSVEYVLQFVQEAIKKGLNEIQILDHTHRFKEFEGIVFYCKNRQNFHLFSILLKCKYNKLYCRGNLKDEKIFNCY